MRTFKSNKYKGLNGATIKHEEVNADLKGAIEGDMFSNSAEDWLIYYNYGFKIATNIPNHYLTKEDLKCKFINLRIENENSCNR